jgi:hypothetical protein
LDSSEGHSKKFLTDLDVCWINFRGTNQPQNIFSWLYFSVRFWAFLSKGGSKTRLKKKCPRKLFRRKFLENRQKFRCQFCPRFFLFYLVFRCYLAMGVQKHNKKCFTKKSCRKFLQKKTTKNQKPKPKPDFSRFVLSRFGRGHFSVRGGQKHDKNLRTGGQKKPEPPQPPMPQCPNAQCPPRSVKNLLSAPCSLGSSKLPGLHAVPLRTK